MRYILLSFCCPGFYVQWVCLAFFTYHREGERERNRGRMCLCLCNYGVCSILGIETVMHFSLVSSHTYIHIYRFSRVFMLQFNISSQEFLKSFCKFVVSYTALCSFLQYLNVSSEANIMHMILSDSQNKRPLKAMLSKREYIHTIGHSSNVYIYSIFRSQCNGNCGFTDAAETGKRNICIHLTIHCVLLQAVIFKL